MDCLWKNDKCYRGDALHSGKENVPFEVAYCVYYVMPRPNKTNSAESERGVLRTAKGDDRQLTRYPSQT